MKTNFGRLMHNLALVHGEREALVNVERARRYSFRALHLLSNRIADAINTGLGLVADDRFMLILENDNLSLLQFPTFMKVRATAVMTNLRDAAEEHRWQIEMLRPKAAFIETALVPSHAAMLRSMDCEVIAMDPLTAELQAQYPFVRCFWDLIAAASDSESPVERDAFHDTVLIRFTGGTTGRGKCAMYTMDNWLGGRDSCLANVDMGFDRNTRFLHAAPLSHGTQLFLYPTMFTGGAAVTMNALTLEGVINLIQQERITHSFLVPTVLYRLLDAQRQKPRDLGSLRTLIYGAAPISPERLGELVQCFGQIFVQAYAATEAISVISCLEKQAHCPDDPAHARRLASAGRITPGVEVYIADADCCELPVGETGEIMVRGRAVISGYFGDRAATAKEFVDGAWRSGDVGYIDEAGHLFIVDRLKDMIISGGFNIYASEVEAALATHPAVFMSAVVGLPHADWGEAVHAEVQLREAATVSEMELIEHVKAQIGSYKAPKSVGFSDQLPVSSVGKVLRREVRARIRSAV